MKPARSLLLFFAGIFAAGLSAYYAASRPRPDPIAPQDAELQKQLAALSGATPEAAAQLEARLAAARSRLPAAKAFDAWRQSAWQNWIVETHSTDFASDLELRHYGLSYDHPKMSSWPEIIETVKILCAKPGLTIDRLVLIAAPDGADVFQRVEISLTARLQP